MSADFWAGYASGAMGILIGNPLDILKVQLQAGQEISLSSPRNNPASLRRYTSLIRGVTAPILGYGALNALLFLSYNRTLFILDPTITSPTALSQTSLTKIWTAGAIGGLATWIISAPTELIKCRTQLSGISGRDGLRLGSVSIAKEIWRRHGIKGFYLAGGVTSLRDSVGYGFYFWSYEISKRIILGSEGEVGTNFSVKSLVCGGIAGVVTWASVFPLDTIKTRLQSPQLAPEVQSLPGERRPLVPSSTTTTPTTSRNRIGAWDIASQSYHQEGIRVFFRGLGVCSLRAFIVNAVQWTVYEWIMATLKPAPVMRIG